MTQESWPQRAARVLPQQGLSAADYYLMATAGYRINLERTEFVGHAAWEFQGLGWPEVTQEDLGSALDRLLNVGFMSVLTETDLQEERTRRASSGVPELDDAADYRPGHIDFTERGYLLFRDVTKAIQGEAFLTAQDCGFNLDTKVGRFDFYSVRREDCEEYMNRVRVDGDSYTGIEGPTFVGTDPPVEIAAWRPLRFLLCSSGYHGVLHFTTGVAAQPGVAPDGAAPRR